MFFPNTYMTSHWKEALCGFSGMSELPAPLPLPLGSVGSWTRLTWTQALQNHGSCPDNYLASKWRVGGEGNGVQTLEKQKICVPSAKEQDDVRFHHVFRPVLDLNVWSIFSGISYLLFPYHGWPWVTQTIESKTVSKRLHLTGKTTEHKQIRIRYCYYVHLALGHVASLLKTYNSEKIMCLEPSILKNKIFFLQRDKKILNNSLHLYIYFHIVGERKN